MFACTLIPREGVERVNKILQILQIEHAFDDFSRAIISRDNLPLTLHELAQGSTKDSDALDIETIGNLVDSVLSPPNDIVRPGPPKSELFFKLTETDKL